MKLDKNKPLLVASPAQSDDADDAFCRPYEGRPAKVKRFINHVWNHFRRALGCRLCMRVTVAVFIAILVVEGGILIFSVRNYERDRLFEVEREALVVMRSIPSGPSTIKEPWIPIFPRYLNHYGTVLF